jgi:hypothetical protein
VTDACASGRGVVIAVGGEEQVVCDGLNADEAALSDLQARVAELEDIVNAVVPTTRIFITNNVFSGDLGGLSGADASCTLAASDAGLSGDWIAWLSTSQIAARDRFFGGLGPIRLLDGRLVAASLDELLTRGPRTPINVSEAGVPLNFDATIWTGTTADGDWSGVDCDGWSTVNFAQGSVGLLRTAYENAGDWTNAVSVTCLAPFRLYCVEQSRSIIGIPVDF